MGDLGARPAVPETDLVEDDDEGVERLLGRRVAWRDIARIDWHIFFVLWQVADGSQVDGAQDAGRCALRDWMSVGGAAGYGAPDREGMALRSVTPTPAPTNSTQLRLKKLLPGPWDRPEDEEVLVGPAVGQRERLAGIDAVAGGAGDRDCRHDRAATGVDASRWISTVPVGTVVAARTSGT